MKNIVLIVIVVLLSSCTADTKELKTEFNDIKNIIENSDTLGNLIQSSLQERSLITVTYPDYIVESYQLIKYIIGILSRENQLSLYDPTLKLTAYPNDMVSLLSQKAPQLAFKEYLDLYSYAENQSVILTDTSQETEGIILELLPESLLSSDRTPNKNGLHIVLAGTEGTEFLGSIIKDLPEMKKISAIMIEQSTFTTTLNSYDILMLLDSFTKYRGVSPINNIYNEENYLNAPEPFKAETKSIITSYQINRMNNYLSRLILESNSKFGE